MTKETLEHLSCLMDGELSADAGRFMARRIGSDEKLSGTWQRFHLIRDCLRRSGNTWTLADLDVDLDDLDDLNDSGSQDMPSASRNRWLRPVSGIAIAASVAVVALMLTLNMSPVDVEEPAESFASPNPTNLIDDLPASQAASFNASSRDRQSMNRYLLRHNQAGSVVGRKGFVSFVPAVSTAPVQVIEPENRAAADEASSEQSETPVSER